MENNIKYGTKEIFRDIEKTEDGVENQVWKSRLVCLCGNKMQGTYENHSDVPNDFECEKCGNITFDTRFAINKRYVAPVFAIDFKNNRGFGISRINASIIVNYDNSEGVKDIEIVKINMNRKIVFDIVDRTLICYRNGEVEYDFKKENSEDYDYNEGTLDSINNFVMRNVSVEDFIKQIGTENSISLYTFADKNFSESYNNRSNKRILHRFREMLVNKENLEFVQILSNAGFKNIDAIKNVRTYSYHRRENSGSNRIGGINTSGKTPSQILQVPKSIIKKLLSIKQEEVENTYYTTGLSSSLRAFYAFHNNYNGKYDMNIVNNILNTASDSDSIRNLFNSMEQIYRFINSPEYKGNQKRAIQYITQDLAMYQGITNVREGITLLNDYSDMVKKMGGVPEKYPKSLKRVHDVAMLNYRKWKSELTKEDFLIATRRYSELQYLSNDKKYSFIIPETIGDLVREGNSLNHCIASYDNRVIEGSSQIVFMRDSKEIEKPLVSIEVKNGRVNQARGYSNRDVTSEEHLAILEWADKNHIFY